MILVDSFPGDSDNKESACSTGDPVCSLGWEDPPEKGTSTLSSVLAWRAAVHGVAESDMTEHMHTIYDNVDVPLFV